MGCLARSRRTRERRRASGPTPTARFEKGLIAPVPGREPSLEPLAIPVKQRRGRVRSSHLRPFDERVASRIAHEGEETAGQEDCCGNQQGSMVRIPHLIPWSGSRHPHCRIGSSKPASNGPSATFITIRNVLRSRSKKSSRIALRVEPSDFAASSFQKGPIQTSGKDDQERPRGSSKRSALALFGSHMSIAGGCDPGGPGRSDGRVRDGAALYKKQQPVERLPSRTSTWRRFQRGPCRRRGSQSRSRTRAYCDQSRQPGRDPLGEIDRGDGQVEVERCSQLLQASPTWSCIRGSTYGSGREARVARSCEGPRQGVQRRTGGWA